MAPGELARYLSRTDPLFLSAAIAMVCAAALLDCLLYQLLRGEVDLPLAAFWLAAAAIPWALCWVGMQHLRAAGAASPRAWAFAIGSTAFLAALLDLLLLGDAGLSGTALARNVQAELPVAIGFVALAFLARRHEQRPVRAEAQRRFSRLIGCDLCSAAGNYVEVVRGGRVEMIRASLADIEAELRTDGYIRVHRSALVRETSIVAFENDRRGLVAIRLATGERVKVGRSYRAALYRLRRRSA